MPARVNFGRLPMPTALPGSRFLEVFRQSLNDLHTLFSLQAEVLSLKTNAVRSLPTRES